MTALDQSPAAAPPVALPVMLPRDPHERLAALFDPGTLEVLPVETEERSGTLAGTGLVHGVSAVAFASDARVQGGAMSTAGCAAIVAAYAEATSRGVPIVGLWHSGGARLAEGVASLHAVGTVFAAMTQASGRVLQISVVLGPAAGGRSEDIGGRAELQADPLGDDVHVGAVLHDHRHRFAEGLRVDLARAQQQ